MRVVVAHDYATQRGGAERVALEILDAFPGARLVTSVYRPETTFPEFEHQDLTTLWLDKVRPFRRDPRRAFPLLARSFETHHVSDADVVVASSSGWAHRIRSDAPVVVYCHNPARWLYQPEDYFPRLPRSARRGFTASTQGLRRSDHAAALRASRYLVNSSVVAQRVREQYGIEAEVCPPSRGVNPDGDQHPVPGIEPGFLLTVARQRGYKRTDAVQEAVRLMPDERLVVVGGDEATSADGRIRVLRNVSDAELRWLYDNAAALVAVGNEDFGLTPVEAQGFGTPTITLRHGGYLDTTVEGVTGLFVEDVGVLAISTAIHELRSRTWDSDAIKKCGDRYSRQAFQSRLRASVESVHAAHSAKMTP